MSRLADRLRQYTQESMHPPADVEASVPEVGGDVGVVTDIPDDHEARFAKKLVTRLEDTKPFEYNSTVVKIVGAALESQLERLAPGATVNKPDTGCTPALQRNYALLLARSNHRLASERGSP